MTRLINGRRFFDLPVDGENMRPSSNAYVLKNLMDLGGVKDSGGLSMAEDSWIIPASVIGHHTKAPSEKVKIFDVKENTMVPDYRHGEHVLVDESVRMPSPPGVFILSDGFGYLIRQCEVIAGSKPTKIKVSAQDENFISQIIALSDVQIIGRVIAKLEWV